MSIQKIRNAQEFSARERRWNLFLGLVIFASIAFSVAVVYVLAHFVIKYW